MQQNRRNLPRYLVNKPGLQWSAQRRRASAWGVGKEPSKHSPGSHGARASIGRARAWQGWTEQAHLDVCTGSLEYATCAAHNASDDAESETHPQAPILPTSMNARLPTTTRTAPVSCLQRCSPAAKVFKRECALKKMRYQDEHL